jgi:transcriptional regulator with XRE-family HTH domain
VDADIEMGRRIRRRRRREKGISQRDLAGHLGLTFQQVQKYEEGINRVGAARLQQIAKMLGVDISFFYDGDGKEPAVESLLVLNSVFSLRLLRAYTALKDQVVQRQLVILVEMIAASQRWFYVGYGLPRKEVWLACAIQKFIGSRELRRASKILNEYGAAQSALIGKAVVLPYGKAGTVENVWLDELHGLRISIEGRDGRPVSTIKLAES